MGLSIKDVSKKAEVSIASVSRYINNKNSVSQKTAKKIEEAIESLNFRPNIIGRSLRTGKSKLIGVIVPSFSNPVFSDAMAGIQQLAKEHGYTMLVVDTEYDSSNEENAIEALLSNGVDGLIITVSCEQESEVLKKLDIEKIPYVLLYNNTNSALRSTVSIDNAQASVEVAKYLIDLGHKNFGIISILSKLSDRAKSRKDAFIHYVNSQGFENIELIEIESPSEDIRERLLSLYSNKSAPTALFCSNDAIALHAINQLKKIGIAVPQDVSVIGFDGIKIGELIDPVLSTIVQPSVEMGKKAFEQLYNQITNSTTQKTILLPFELKIAGTTSTPNP